MKNKIFIIIIILFQLFLINKSFSNEIDFQATDIEISNDQNLTIANNGTAIVKDDGIIIKGKKIKYFKDKSLLIINNGKISSIDKNFEINSEIIEYKINESNLNFENNIVINDGMNNLIINSSRINYDLDKRKIISQDYSEIFDDLDNTYKVDGFEYSIKDKTEKITTDYLVMATPATVSSKLLNNQLNNPLGAFIKSQKYVHNIHATYLIDEDEISGFHAYYYPCGNWDTPIGAIVFHKLKCPESIRAPQGKELVSIYLLDKPSKAIINSNKNDHSYGF